MKRTALILLICIYSLATVGFTLKEFYCCAKFKSVSVTLVQDIKQKCSKGNEKSGCCDNKYHFYKVKDNYFAGDDVKIPVKHFTKSNLFTPSFQQISFASQQTHVANRSNAPPLYNGVPDYLFNCVFRI